MVMGARLREQGTPHRADRPGHWSPSLSRREFVMALGALAAGAGLAGCWDRPGQGDPLTTQRQARMPGDMPTLDEFLALSAMLTGTIRLNRDVAGLHLAKLQAQPDTNVALADLCRKAGFRSITPPKTLEDLTQRSVLEQDSLRRLADQITTCWYTGKWTRTDEPTPSGFADALAWNVLAFSKPPGTCGGSPGSWAEPPVRS